MVFDLGFGQTLTVTPLATSPLVNGGGPSALEDLQATMLYDVPEPTSLGIVALGCLMLFRKRRDRSLAV